MELVRHMPEKPRRPGRPRAIPKDIEPVVLDLWQRGYGYRAIARILSSSGYGINPHFSSIRQTLIRLGKI